MTSPNFKNILNKFNTSAPVAVNIQNTVPKKAAKYPPVNANKNKDKDFEINEHTKPIPAAGIGIGINTLSKAKAKLIARNNEEANITPLVSLKSPEIKYQDEFEELPLPEKNIKIPPWPRTMPKEYDFPGRSNLKPLIMEPENAEIYDDVSTPINADEVYDDIQTT